MREEKIFTGASAITATTNSSDFDKPSDAIGAMFLLNISAASGTTPTLDLKVQVKDNVSGVYIDLPSSSFAQKTGTGSDSLLVYPGITAAANRAVSYAIPKSYRVVATVGGTTPSFTFTVTAQYLKGA